MNVQQHLADIAALNGIAADTLQLPDCAPDPAAIRVVMVSEVPPPDPADGFYSAAPDPDYMKTTRALFERGGLPVKAIEDILNLGIYITTAVKSPKSGYAVPTDIIKAHLPLLRAELALFPHLKAVMLMGDVAKKAVNMLAKAETGKNVIPSESTYKIRQNEYFWGDLRVFPSYIMTGGNILIEKSKCEMIADDIRRMSALIRP